MKHSHTVAAIVATVILIFTPHVSYSLGFEVAAGFWGQNPSGNLSYNPLGPGDTLDLENDLKYEEEYKPFGRVKIDMPLLFPNIYIMVSPMKFEETGSKASNFKFGDVSFDVTAPFNTRVEMDLYDVGFYYSIPLLETATLNTLNAEFGVNMRIIDLVAEVTGRNSALGITVTETESEVLPVPMVYAGIQFNPIDMFSIEAEGRGIAYSSNHYYDFIGRIKIKPMDPVFIAGGYRHSDIKIDYEDVEAEIEFSGPFLEGGIFF